MANEGAIVNAMAAAETELANSKDQIVVLNEEISKYKSAFEMIIKDLQPSTDAFAGETLDPFSVHMKSMEEVLVIHFLSTKGKESNMKPH